MVSVKKGSTVLTVMEQAVTNFGRSYRFSATYFGGDLGYFIDTINGTTSDSPCFWFLYTSTPTSCDETLSPVGVSTATVNKGSSVTWRFEQFTICTFRTMYMCIHKNLLSLLCCSCFLQFLDHQATS